MKHALFSLVPFLIAQGLSLFVTLLILIGYGTIVLGAGSGDYEAFENTLLTLMRTQETLLATQMLWATLCFDVFATWYHKHLQGDATKPTIKRLIPYVPIFLLAHLGLGVLLFLVARIIPEAMESYNTLLNLELNFSLFVYSVFFAPISEEYLFRGVTLGIAKRVSPFWGANLLQAALFGLLHGNLIQGLYAFGFGLFLGHLKERQKSIFVPIILHVLFNLCTFLPLPALGALFILSLIMARHLRPLTISE